jgi:hypothetical protein
MIDGITILNMYVNKVTILNLGRLFGALWPLYIAMGIFIIVNIIDWYIYDLSEFINIIFIGLAVLGVIGTFIYINTQPDKYFYDTIENTTRYEVIVDKSVSMTEFYNNYKVIDQRGDIWTIEVKEDAKD